MNLKTEKGTNRIYLTTQSFYPVRRRVILALLSIAVGVIIAGFWNYNLVDGFGHDIVAKNMVGESSQAAGSFKERGFSFGVLFAFAAGLAATFTACNCVTFSMLPSLACATDRTSTRKTALKALGVFSLGVILVTAIYGFYTGSMGSEVVQKYNERGIRLSQATITFTLLGLFMLIWGAISFGFLSRLISRIPLPVRNFFGSSLIKAGLMGLQVGLFTVGRPFGVFRDFLTYAASARNPLYGAFVMSVQGVGQIVIMVILFLLILLLFGKRLGQWSKEKPQQAELFSTIALLLGGAYFIFYWGFAVPFGLGRWGEWFGWY
ncbi:hypothetical protein QUF84_00435 [Fictibacillus enclensis]|uniref:sulfite exporter TauE/SafE family protein n=1 Tax=Fictibacillus enclensis TaxID=1017270 RepID=UPI0025A142C4|nr:sulfite exporter TauE/SafE family protein [Fictibacillus enclensis]MDM5335763.1 hypothetical protein [Fictibacillus enclensis]